MKEAGNETDRSRNEDGVQIESTNQNAALNEIYMTWRYAPNPATKETAESLLDKLRPLSDQECMDLIRKGPVKIYAQNCLQAPAE